MLWCNGIFIIPDHAGNEYLSLVNCCVESHPAALAVLGELKSIADTPPS